MPSLSDFSSLPVMLQATLALLAALMAWRGAHLAGDSNKWRATLWGLASVATFVIALLIGAVANHDSREELRTANGRADQNKHQLDNIQGGISELKRALSSNSDSVTDILSLAISRLQGQQQEIAKLKRAARLDNHVYENGQDRAIVGNVNY